jgi:cysteine synthase B
MPFPTLEDIIGKSPLVRLQRINTTSNTLLVKLEGHNPGGSVKDRPAYNMIRRAEEEGRIKPGDTLIEATSGNTGIGLAMVAAIKGYKMILVMPESASVERRQVMKAYGADLHLVPAKASMEGAIDYARDLESKGAGVILDQFANPHNPEAHQLTTGPEIWEATEGKITHFVASTGTTGTIMGTGRFLKSQNPGVQIVGVIPAEGSKIPGIRKWPEAYQPKIYHPEELDQTLEVNQGEAEEMARRLAREEGLFVGISSGGNVAAALRLAETVENSLIVVIICDRGDKYLSTGVFPA